MSDQELDQAHDLPLTSNSPPTIDKLGLIELVCPVDELSFDKLDRLTVNLLSQENELLREKFQKLNK